MVLVAPSESLAIQPEKLHEGELTDINEDRMKMSQRKKSG